jgi:hypothetical protein
MEESLVLDGIEMELCVNADTSRRPFPEIDDEEKNMLLVLSCEDAASNRDVARKKRMDVTIDIDFDDFMIVLGAF